MSGTRTFSDAVLALFVIAIVAMLIIPLPTFFIDILIVVNISFALLLLLVGLYMPNALALLSFPTLLLLTTLFRLGLNVASTRLILSQGDAGQVIQAFGTFLVRGEILVGVIIFTIITIVNFIVIAKGSSRVSVVAARFTLDSLPGKQAAIDADLRAGLIDNSEALKRREDLRKESQLYGSMDGSMQFVQGDAIAGFFITLTNIFGGIYLGISKGQTFSDALNTYTILTVGDGLVTQIPALLISICAGIVVTRVSSGERATLSSDLSKQLFSNPLTLVFAGLILLLIGLMPGLPFLPFLLVSVMFMLTSALLKRSPAFQSDQRKLLEYKGTASAQPGSAKSEELLAHSQGGLKILLDKGLGYRLFAQREAHYRTYWDKLRQDYFNEVGMSLPDIRVEEDPFLSNMEYAVVVSGNIVEKDILNMDAIMLEVNPDFAYLYNLQVLKETFHPLTQQRVSWVSAIPLVQQIVETSGLRKYDFFEYITLRIAVFYNQNPQELVTISEIHTQLKLLEKQHPGFVADVLSRNFLDVPRLCELIQLLVLKSVNVRDFKQIVEQVAGYCSTNSIGASEVDAAVLEDLVHYVKNSRKRVSVVGLSSALKTSRVITLAPELENMFAENYSDWVSGADPEIFSNLSQTLNDLIRPVMIRGLLPVSLLIRPYIRSNLESFIEAVKSPVQIITYDELGKDTLIERIGSWQI